MSLINSNCSLLNIMLNSIPGVSSEVSELDSSHLVQGECTCLVTADDCGATQGLHTGQGTHNGSLFGHLVGAKSQTRGDHSGQSLGMAATASAIAILK